MVVLFALADANCEEKGEVVPGVRPLPFDEAGARPERTRRASRLRTESFGLRLGRTSSTACAKPLDLGTKTTGRTTIPNLVML